MSQVNHAPHYGGANNQYEAIKVIEAWQLDFCLGNVVKYISRAGKKDDIVQDLKKALWYIQRKIYQLESTKKSESETISFDINSIVGEKECEHPYAYIYEKCGYAKCNKCGKILCEG